ncbi:reverse transcriptase-like protein, partial [Paenibacillus apiarius]|uniref:reverse transcriptase-like protein n=1 Tax=Paenibacillus apiarius TaxID=46240 RepID=UPI003B3BC2FB
SRAFSLTKACSNNVAEYNALLIGLQLAEEIGIQQLEAYGDSKLIVNQVEENMKFVIMISYHTIMRH